MSTKTILHVDMDAFFAAIEQHDRPELRGQPIVVGAPPDKRGVVSTCSYEARKYGIHSAMPSRTAYRLCPHAVFLPLNGKHYREVSEQIMKIFRRFTPKVEPVSIDEAFLDVTGVQRLFGHGPQIAKKIKAAIFAETGLTCSVGVAPNMFLAKIASDLNKPDGLTVVPSHPKLITAFLAPLSVSRMWGAGKKTQELLKRIDITTFGHLQRAQSERVEKQLGTAAARSFLRLAHGIDGRELQTEHEEKSISNETTFDDDQSSTAVIEGTLLDLVDKVGSRLRNAGFYAGTAHLKLRWKDFSTITRQCTLHPPCCDDITLRETALELARKKELKKPVRLIGFGVSKLNKTAEAPQMELFASKNQQVSGRRETLSRTVDLIRHKFGLKSICRGSAMSGNEKEN